MSLTRQLADKNSSVRKFFEQYENKEGVKHCLALLQSISPIRQSLAKSSSVVDSYIGTTIDYLIRYTANGNRLAFNETIAHSALRCANAVVIDSGENPIHANTLYQIGSKYLDGRSATDKEAIYAATAFAVLDHMYRSGSWPKLFREAIQKEDIERLRKTSGKTIKERTTKFLFDEFYEKNLGGKRYQDDLENLVKTFVAANEMQNGELFGGRGVIFNRALENGGLVQGADFDCVIEYKRRVVLTDIKTTKKRLTVKQFRQIIGYALLHDQKKDKFKFTDIGVYFSRSGSFRFLPAIYAIKQSLHGFNSVAEAQKAFIQHLSKARRINQENSKMSLVQWHARVRRIAKACPAPEEG